MLLLAVMNGMRQCIAVAFFFYSCRFIEQRRVVPYLISLSIALLFHYSCVILFPLYFILNKKSSMNIYVILYIASFAFCFINVQGLLGTLSYYLSIGGGAYQENFEYYASSFGRLSLMGFMFQTFINVCIFIAMMKAKSYERFPLFTNCTIITLILKNLSFNMPIVGRVALYFSWFPYLLIPLLIPYLSKDRQTRKAIKFFFVVLYAVAFIHNILSREMKMLPYFFSFNTII